MASKIESMNNTWNKDYSKNKIDLGCSKEASQNLSASYAISYIKNFEMLSESRNLGDHKFEDQSF